MAKEINILIAGELIYSNSEEAINIQATKRIGEYKEGKVHYSPEEALYLIEKNSAKIKKNNKEKSFDEILSELSRKDKSLFAKYCAFKDLVNKGYIVKTGLKFGGEYRVYEKKEEHAKWVLYVLKEKDSIKIQELASKNRVAHSTNKKLLIAVVDNQGETTYYELEWKKL
ncbi:MAG: tRNA-intron lyase [Nanoarchaeota archaeon]